MCLSFVVIPLSTEVLKSEVLFALLVKNWVFTALISNDRIHAIFPFLFDITWHLAHQSTIKDPIATIQCVIHIQLKLATPTNPFLIKVFDSLISTLSIASLACQCFVEAIVHYPRILISNFLSWFQILLKVFQFLHF